MPGLLHPVRRVEVNGLDLHLDERTESVNAESLTDGNYEADEIRFMERFVRPGDTFLDLGANVGFVSCQAARWVGDKGQVFAFEPDRLNFRLLRRNLRTNRSGVVEAVRAAVSESNGTITLHRSLVNCGDHRIYGVEAGKRVEEQVRTIQLDDYLESRASRVDFVKMDVQGAESLVVRGMQRILAENRDHITLLVEWWPHGLERAGSSPAELAELFSRHGLNFWTLDGEPATDLCDPERLADPSFYTNVIVRLARPE